VGAATVVEDAETTEIVANTGEERQFP